MAETAITTTELAEPVSPGAVVYRAVERLTSASAAPWHAALAELLSTLADDMNDEQAQVTDFPENIPGHRQQVTYVGYGVKQVVRYDWTDAWKLAVAILGEES